jgi:aminoglycoside phosphotransferase (APT) family kinase protein
MRFPNLNSAQDLSVETLNRLVATLHPEARVQGFELVDSLLYGSGQVSTADRLVLDLHYAPGAAATLPRRVMLKTTVGSAHAPATLYENEVAFYARIRPMLDLEVPRCIGAIFDADSGQFCLMLEDLRERQARFPNVTQSVSLEEVRSLLDLLARLHAPFWASPRLSTDLAWLQTHQQGGLHDFFGAHALAMAESQAAAEPFKQALVDRLGRSTAQLWRAVQAAQARQALGPQTLLHGDAHIGNTYLLPEGVGLLDWQLMVRGSWAHDVSYLIATALPTELRRSHERELLAHYLDALQRHGLAQPPSADSAWVDYRLGLLWDFFIGWLICPLANYSQAIVEGNMNRIAAALLDLDVLPLLDAH